MYVCVGSGEGRLSEMLEGTSFTSVRADVEEHQGKASITSVERDMGSGHQAKFKSRCDGTLG